MRTFLKLLFTLVIVVVLALATEGAARADAVVFSNFGPGMTFDINHGYTIAGSATNTAQVVANSFTVAGNVNFTTAQLALGLVSGPNMLQVLLVTDAGGVPGSIIETMNVNIGPFGLDSVVTATSILNPLLTSGTTYWLMAFTPSANTLAGWNFSLIDTSPPSPYFASNQIASTTGPWVFGSGPRSAFQINGTPVPEPATILSLGAGIMAIVFRRRKYAARE